MHMDCGFRNKPAYVTLGNAPFCGHRLRSFTGPFPGWTGLDAGSAGQGGAGGVSL